jgi:parvulin-like peptidyl-prolyl isomerase
MFMKSPVRFVALLLAAGVAMGYRVPAAQEAPAAAKPAAKTADLFADLVVAKGKNVEIKRSQLDEAMVTVKSGAVARGSVIPPDQMPTIEKQVLDRLIQIQILLAKATPADKKTGQEVTTQRFDAIKERAGSDDVLNRQLKSFGTTPEELRAKMTEECTAQAVMERELNIKISDEDVKKFYDENPSKFEQPEMVRASHVLVSTRDAENKELPEDQKAAKKKKAEDILKRARGGEDFAKLAKEFSDDPGSKDKGGEYTFPRGQMVPEFENTAFSLKVDEISDLVPTQFGYHIIKLSEKIPAKKVELSKVAPDVKEYLKQQAMQKRDTEIKDYLVKLSKEANVEILDETLKSAGAAKPAESK